MRDWSSVVRARLIALGIDAEREEQIRAELAGHLEDAYADAIRRGRTKEDAAARALAQVPDWTRLADAIRRAVQKEGPMSPDAKTLWVPGMAALGCAAAVMLGVPRLLPASLWLDPRATMPMTAGLLLSYLAFGALGASLSRRCTCGRKLVRTESVTHPPGINCDPSALKRPQANGVPNGRLHCGRRNLLRK